MSKRRMTTLDIIDTDAFLEMPQTSQNLYFHLNGRADDDGFIAGVKRIVRMIGAGQDDLKILIGKKFLIKFDDGVCVIKHWRISNTIRKDRYKETQYLNHKNTLFIRKNGAYTLNEENDCLPVPKGHFILNDVLVDQMATNGRRKLNKVKLNKVKLTKETVDLPEWLNKKSWEEWKQYRKEIKKALKPSTEKKQLSFLEKNKKDHVEIINNSIQNGWTGLFELKGGSFKKTNLLNTQSDKYNNLNVIKG